MGKISIGHIVTDHLKTLWNINENRASYSDRFLFFILPFFISGILVMLSISINNVVGDLIKAIAIFSAFLFNMLAIVNSSIKLSKVKNDDSKLSLKRIYAEQIHSNLSFNILVGILLVTTLVIQSMIFSRLEDCFAILRTIDFINIYLLIVFLLTLLMCLNRVYILMKK